MHRIKQFDLSAGVLAPMLRSLFLVRARSRFSPRLFFLRGSAPALRLQAHCFALPLLLLPALFAPVGPRP